MSDQPQAPETSANEKVRVSADLPVGTIEVLRQLAASQNVSLTEALRRAIATEGLLQSRLKANNKVLLESSDGRQTELVFRNS